MARKTEPPAPDDRPEVTRIHTCVHERNWKDARESTQRLSDILKMLLQLEPGLDKYRKHDDWWGATWDVQGMTDALEFRRLQGAHDQYATPVVSETTTEKTKE